MRISITKMAIGCPNLNHWLSEASVSACSGEDRQLASYDNMPVIRTEQVKAATQRVGGCFGIMEREVNEDRTCNEPIRSNRSIMKTI